MTATLTDFVTADKIVPVTTRLEEAFKLADEILTLEARIAELEERRQFIIQEHIGAGVVEEGPFTLQKKVTRRATVNPEKFAEKYPDEYLELVKRHANGKYKPTQKEAAEVLTSYQIEKISDVKESVTYSVDWDMRAEP